MALKTPLEYVESLRALNIRAYVGGERVDSVVDHPAIAPHINTVAKTYELAHVEEHREVMTTISHLTGERIHRYTHIFQSADDLVKKIQMLRLLGHFLNADAERGNLLFLRTNLNFDLTRLLARALKLGLRQFKLAFELCNAIFAERSVFASGSMRVLAIHYFGIMEMVTFYTS